MRGAWREFVGTEGARERGPGDDGLCAAFEGGFGSLDDLAVLDVSGSDARSFLQGQLTCDVALVDQQTSALGAWCNAKGRAEVLFRLLAAGDSLRLLLPAGQLESVMRRLRLYVLRADVQLRDESEDRVVLWAAGAAPAAALAGELALPRAVNGVASDGDTSVVLLPGPTPTHLIVAGTDRARALWRTLAGCAEPLAAEAWELNRVRAAEPSVVEATAGAFVPQMFNLELLGGISFTKGCYIGQEVVARTQHLGKLKRRMIRARVGGSPRPGAGDAIYESSGAGTQSVGTVVRAAPSPQGGWELLAVVRIESVERDALRLHQVLGAALELEPLPYALEEERADTG